MEAYTHDFVARFPHLIQEVNLVLVPVAFSGNKPIQQSSSILRHLSRHEKEGSKTVLEGSTTARNDPPPRSWSEGLIVAIGITRRGTLRPEERNGAISTTSERRKCP
jgi:hypothetical protein